MAKVKIFKKASRYISKWLRGKQPVLRQLVESDEELQNGLKLLIEKGDWIKLEQKGGELLLQSSPPVGAIETVAYNLQQAGRFEAASAIAAQAAKLFSDKWIFHSLASVSLRALGKSKEALEFLQQALSITPRDPQTLREWADTLVKVKGMDQAVLEYQEHCRQFDVELDIVVAPLYSIRDWAKKGGLSLLEIDEIEEIPYKAPHIWGKVHTAEVTFLQSNKPYVAEITNARIFSHSSIILTSDGAALHDSAGHPQWGHMVSFAYEKVVIGHDPGRLMLKLGSYRTREIEEGMFLSGLASNAFGHWIPEFLPKLRFLQQHPDFSRLPIIVDATMPQSHFDHLRRLASNALILLEANESFLCRRLFVAPTPSFSAVEMYPQFNPVHEIPGLSPKALKFVRGSECEGSKRRPNRRLFLARRNMKWRRLMNEEEIAADLQKLGFEMVFLENMTVREQINLFQQALWIVAPNGSALLNLIFADTRVKLVVLTQPNLHNWGTFQGPMEALGYESICVRGDYALNEDMKHSDYTVPIESIRAALSYLGLKEAMSQQ